MNYRDRKLDELFDAVRRSPQLLTPEHAARLLDMADTRRVTGTIIAFLQSYVGIATTTVGLVAGAVATFSTVGINHAPRHERAVETLVQSELSPIPSLVESTVVPFRSTPVTSVSDSALPGTPEIRVCDGMRTVATPIVPLAARDRDRSLIDDGVRLGLPFAPDANERVSSFTLAAGSAYTMLRGGMRTPFHERTAAGIPQNFVASAPAWGYAIDAAAQARLTSSLSIVAHVGYASLRASYAMADIAYVSPLGTPQVAVPTEHALTVALGVVSFDPAIRIDARGVGFVEAGLGAAYVVQQQAQYIDRVTDAHAPQGAAAAIDRALQTTHIGTARVAFEGRVAAGADIAVGNALTVQAGLEVRYGLTPLFSDNYPQAITVTPTVGVRMLVP